MYKSRSHAPVKVVKASGIICFKKNRLGQLELCLVKRRCSYEFVEFVRYWAIRDIVNTSIFDRMTTEEKVDIMSLDFATMERRISMTFDMMDPAFIRRKNKFERQYLFDGGKRLIDMIKKSKSYSAMELWEPPKGRPQIIKRMMPEFPYSVVVRALEKEIPASKLNILESELECAIREFHEEANITKDQYKVYPGRCFTYSFVDSRVLYKNKYFLAFYTDTKDPPHGVSFTNTLQIREIADVRWFTLEYIRLISRTNVPSQSNLEQFLKPIFTIAHKFM